VSDPHFPLITQVSIAVIGVRYLKKYSYKINVWLLRLMVRRNSTVTDFSRQTISQSVAGVFTAVIQGIGWWLKGCAVQLCK